MTGRLHRAYAAYRASGADLPFRSPLPAHDVAMEGYFWRFTDLATGRVVITLNGVNRGPDGHWATLGLASQPNGFLRTVAHPHGHADPDRFAVSAGDAFFGDEHRVRVDLGPGARLDVTVSDPVPWPRRSVGGCSVFQAVPGLNQYWHPWLLGGNAHGTATLGDDTWDLDGSVVYAEKNWGKGGFPDSWWWGQAHGFDDPGVCVAFGGALVHAGPLHMTTTAVVVLLPDGTLVWWGNPVTSPVHAEVTDERWHLRGRSASWQVEIEGSAPLDDAHVLPVPLPAEGRNVAGSIEHLAGRMRVTVRRRGRTAWQGTSALAALEHGSIERARAEVRRRGQPPEATDAPPVLTG